MPVPKGNAPIKAKGMKREGNLYQNIASMQNLILADKKARKGKMMQYGIKLFDRNKEENLMQLHQALINKTYTTSTYTIIHILDPKPREIRKLPYPDRVIHHATMNVIESIFVSTFTSDTYSCIKKRGIHAASKAVKKALRDEPNTQYCLKLDIKKFYQNIDHDILKRLLRKKIKDKDLLWLLDDIIDSAPGVPIGNYLSQYFANFYLSYLDHWLKEVKKVKYYFRYADDMVILAPDKVSLHQLLADIRQYLRENLKLEIKDNYQIFPVKARGIDFVGYKHFHTHVLLRKRTKKNDFTEWLAARLEQAYIENEDALKILRSRNVKKAFHYEDPPYYNADMGHYAGYTIDDYKKLLEFNGEECKGKFLLSSYNSDILQEYIARYDWDVKYITHRVKAPHKRSPTKTEVLVWNYDVAKESQPTLF